MKLKLFEEYNISYVKITYDDFKEMIPIGLSKGSLSKLSNLFNKDRMLIRTQKSINDTFILNQHEKYYFNIISRWLYIMEGLQEALIEECSDEWFRITYYNNDTHRGSQPNMIGGLYKCDQIDGVIRLLKDKRII